MGRTEPSRCSKSISKLLDISTHQCKGNGRNLSSTAPHLEHTKTWGRAMAHVLKVKTNLINALLQRRRDGADALGHARQEQLRKGDSVLVSKERSCVMHRHVDISGETVGAEVNASQTNCGTRLRPGWVLPIRIRPGKRERCIRILVGDKYQVCQYFHVLEQGQRGTHA